MSVNGRPCWLRRCRAAALVLWVAVLPRAATAQDQPPAPEATRPLHEALYVSFDGRCLRQGPLVARVARWLQRTDVDARLSITVEGYEDPELRVWFAMERDGKSVSVRRFENVPGGCDELAGALSLAIALAIDATILDRVAEPQPPPPPPPAPERRIAIVAEPQLLWRVLPAAAYAARLGVGAGLGERIAVEASFVLTETVQTAVASGDARVALAAGRLDACHGPLAGRVRPRACAGVLAGRVGAAGVGFSPSLADGVLWAAGVARAELRLGLSSVVSLTLAVDGFVALARPSLAVEGVAGQTVASRRLPAVGAAGGIGLAFGSW